MKKASYGIDAPTVVRNLALAGAVSLGLGIFARSDVAADSALSAVAPFFSWLVWPGVAWLLTAWWMLWGSLVFKKRTRDRLLDRVALTGRERVLDVGCGRGLLLIAAAKRLRGKGGAAVGIDLWRTVDQSGNDAGVTRANAEAEGVLDTIALETGDMTKMPFADASFDIVVSSWAIHNVPSADGRKQALREIARVLKPGGRVDILDIGPGRKYGGELVAAGLVEVVTRLDDAIFLIPTWSVRARKRAPAADSLA
ncbi:MAG TPA: class I SAM-dependent methyltransferase [Myxococcota bacterium]|jgi:SAM-dependent methyltransferase